MKAGTSFSYRNGLKKTPEFLNAGELSVQIRNKLWAIFSDFLNKHIRKVNYLSEDYYLVGSNGKFVSYIWFEFLEKDVDEMPRTLNQVSDFFKNWICRFPYNEVFDLVEHFLAFEGVPQPHKKAVIDIFNQSNLAYRIDVNKKYIYEVSSEAQAKAVSADLAIIGNARLPGVSDHLEKAASAINEGRFDDSIRESIHAVESVACGIAGKKKTLSDAIKILEASGIKMNPAFKNGLEKLYAYTNDERGIRHSGLGETKTDHADAQFMFSACAAFCAYLAEKGRMAKINA